LRTDFHFFDARGAAAQAEFASQFAQERIVSGTRKNSRLVGERSPSPRLRLEIRFAKRFNGQEAIEGIRSFSKFQPWNA
jgi:hypothetical protein